MMKKLYKTNRVISTEIKTKYGKKILVYVEGNYYSQLQYGEPYDYDIGVNLDGFDEIAKSEGYSNGKTIKGRQWTRFPYTNEDGYREWIKVYKDEFMSYKQETRYEEFNKSDIRMDRLITNLSADQFIEYMKDNGLGMESVR